MMARWKCDASKRAALFDGGGDDDVYARSEEQRQSEEEFNFDIDDDELYRNASARQAVWRARSVAVIIVCVQ
jgi:hypothetical protein